MTCGSRNDGVTGVLVGAKRSDGAPVFRRILLGYDGTSEGETALREGAMLASACGAEVHLLCIIPQNSGGHLIEGGQGGAPVPTFGEYRLRFEEAQTRLRELGLSPACRIVTGEPAVEVAAYAEQISAEVVVSPWLFTGAEKRATH